MRYSIMGVFPVPPTLRFPTAITGIEGAEDVKIALS
jgi:hypothetical protein